MFSAVIKKNLNEKIATQLINKILNDKLKPGDKLPSERELALAMKVNRNTLREALRKLEILGLINIKKSDGIYIKNYKESGNLELLKIILQTESSLSPVILEGILHVRRIVIPEMASLAAENISSEEIIEIPEIIENTNLTIAEKDLEIHKIIASASGNLFYSFFLNFFNDTFMEYSHLYFSEDKNIKKSSNFHRQIFKALKNRDSDKCKKLMLDILLYAERQILKKMELKHD